MCPYTGTHIIVVIGGNPLKFQRANIIYINVSGWGGFDPTKLKKEGA